MDQEIKTEKIAEVLNSFQAPRLSTVVSRLEFLYIFPEVWLVGLCERKFKCFI